MEFVEPGSMTPEQSRIWLRMHTADIIRYLHQKYMMGISDKFMRFMKGDPCLAHELINDFLLPNDYKIAHIKEYISEGSKIVVIEGDRGEGKTTAGHSFAEWFMESGRQAYWVGAPQELPDQIIRVSDPFDVPAGGGAWTDEIGQKYSARLSGSDENVDDTKVLLTLRHTGRSSFYMTQLSSMTDVNFTRLADALVFKPLSLFGKTLEREEIGKAVPDEFLPNSREYTHFYCKKFRTTFRHPLGDLWDERYSTPFSQITEHTVVDFVSLLLDDGFNAVQITQELKMRSYRVDLKIVEKMVVSRLVREGFTLEQITARVETSKRRTDAKQVEKMVMEVNNAG